MLNLLSVSFVIYANLLHPSQTLACSFLLLIASKMVKKYMRNSHLANNIFENNITVISSFESR